MDKLKPVDIANYELGVIQTQLNDGRYYAAYKRVCYLRETVKQMHDEERKKVQQAQALPIQPEVAQTEKKGSQHK